MNPRRAFCAIVFVFVFGAYCAIGLGLRHARAELAPAPSEMPVLRAAQLEAALGKMAALRMQLAPVEKRVIEICGDAKIDPQQLLRGEVTVDFETGKITRPAAAASRSTPADSVPPSVPSSGAVQSPSNPPQKATKNGKNGR